MNTKNRWNQVRSALIIALLAPAIAFSVSIDPVTMPTGSIANPALSTLNLSYTGGTLYDVAYVIEDATLLADGSTNPDYNADHIWGGDLVAHDVDTTGTFGSELWHARTTLESQNWDSGRYIFTSEGSAGIKFRWADLSASLKTTVDATTAADATATSSPILNWIRGDHSNEVANSGALRTRKYTEGGTVKTYSLGDIIHSGPAYVGAPTESYNFGGYDGFRADYVGRKHLVYVGANDGMLHAFRGDTGAEVFAFIPNAVLGNLQTLTNTGYKTQHLYYVDGSPTAADVCFGSCASKTDWRTVLVGGLRAGGKSIYALNVTDPESVVVNEGAAVGLFLWEYTETDLGYTFSQPQVGRLSDGTWVAVFGNGYDSTNGYSVLYVVNVETGSLIKKITVSTSGTGGLSTPTLVDTNNDNKIDYVYAGDLDGNLWKIDFKTADKNGNNFTTSFSGTPLIDVQQPITMAPKIVELADGTLNVYFGTGQMLTGTDIDDINDHYVYNVQDKGSTTTVSKLNTHTLGQQSYDQPGVDANGDPITTQIYVRYVNGTTYVVGNLGWRVKLAAGERVVNELIVRSSRVTLTTINPSADNNQNWRYGFDYLSGNAPASPFYDLNNSGTIDSADQLDLDLDPLTTDDIYVPVGRDEAFGTVSGPVAARIANDLDVVYVTHGLNFTITASTTIFADPGLAGGHFDVDNFNAANTQFCYYGTEEKIKNMKQDEIDGVADGSIPNPEVDGDKTIYYHDPVQDQKREVKGPDNQNCHKHQYDDSYDVNGVNLIDAIANTNINSNNCAATTTGFCNELKLRELDHSDIGVDPNKWVTIEIINPNATLATNPCSVIVTDPDCGKIVNPGKVFLSYGATNIEEYAPDFNALDIKQRTVKIKDVTRLDVVFDNINALRATEPKCSKEEYSSGISSNLINGNTDYRDGAFVIRVISATNDNNGNATGQGDAATVIYETSIYEHLKEDTLVQAAVDLALANGDITSDQVSCGAPNEQLRAYKDPDKFTGATAGTSGGGSVTVGGGGVGVGFSGLSGTGGEEEVGTDLGQHNWRELLRF